MLRLPPRITSLLASVFILLAPGFSACTAESDPFKQRAENSEEAHFLRAAYTMFEAGRLDELQTVVAPHLQDEEMARNLRMMHEQLPDEAAINQELIRFGVAQGDEREETEVALEYEYSDGFRVVVGTLSTFDGDLRLVGLGIYPQEKSVAAEHHFTLIDKSPVHYGTFLLALGLLLFTLWTWLKALRTKGFGKKVFWSLFILTGLFRLSLNWTTGSLQAQLFAVQLLNAGVSTQGPFSPWMVSISFPLGAIVFWLLRMRRRRKTGKSVLNTEGTNAAESVQAAAQM